MQHAEQECLDAGCSGFLTKPIDFDRLITTLAEIAGIEVTAAELQPTQEETSERSVPPIAAEEILGGDPIVSSLPMHKERFRKIVDQFVDRLDERFDAMEAALEEGDADQLTELGHWLKGASGNCGFAIVAETALKLETHSRQGELDLVPEILNELRLLRARIEVPRSSEEVALTT
jgi:HPt (histidine-containing phosphotransfer) domain-containing protein